MDDVLIHKTTEGIYSERENWWHLVVDSATGARSVRHSWHHKNTHKLYQTTSEGSELMPVLKFLESCTDSTIKKHLEKLLREIGVDGAKRT